MARDSSVAINGRRPLRGLQRARRRPISRGPMRRSTRRRSEGSRRLARGRYGGPSASALSRVNAHHGGSARTIRPVPQGIVNRQSDVCRQRILVVVAPPLPKGSHLFLCPYAPLMPYADRTADDGLINLMLWVLPVIAEQVVGVVFPQCRGRGPLWQLLVRTSCHFRPPGCDRGRPQAGLRRPPATRAQAWPPGEGLASMNEGQTPRLGPVGWRRGPGGLLGHHSEQRGKLGPHGYQRVNNRG
jgi:hypothetical protein